MRAAIAGLLIGVCAILVAATTLNLIGKGTPPWMVASTLGVLVCGSCFGVIVWLFRPGRRKGRGREAVETVGDLEAQGLLESTVFQARRAFRVGEFEDEGPHFFLELADGAVLHLSGQYLEDYEPIEGAPEIRQPRRFPSTEFTVRRHRTGRYAVDLVCGGKVLEPEASLPPFPAEALRKGGVPEDGEVIRDRDYAGILKELRAG